jgi:hypothetical protein
VGLEKTLTPRVWDLRSDQGERYGNGFFLLGLVLFLRASAIHSGFMTDLQFFA